MALEGLRTCNIPRCVEQCSNAAARIVLDCLNHSEAVGKRKRSRIICNQEHICCEACGLQESSSVANGSQALCASSPFAVLYVAMKVIH